MKKALSQFICVASILIWGVPEIVFSQSFNTQFGKNRVQHSDDFKYWNVYETENFLTYFYGKAREVVVPTLQMAEVHHREIQSILEHRTNEKIKIIVYNDLTDLKQSNVGLSDAFVNKTGETKIVGNRMFVYYDGNMEHLQRQVREGIASVYLNTMLFGTNFQEIVQNAVLLDLPEWFKKGIVSYAGRSWDYLLDDELRDLWMQDEGRYRDFRTLSEGFPKIAGHSFWYYMERQYGRSSISNLLYLIRITRNMESSFLYVLGQNYEGVTQEWYDYFSAYYAAEVNKYEDSGAEVPMDLKNKPYVPISKIRVHQNGKMMAYVHNDIGKYRVVLHDLDTDESKIIFTYGYRNNIQATEYLYPALTWHPRRPELTIVYEDKSKLYLRRINFGNEETEEQLIPEVFNTIYNIVAWEEDSYIFSANSNGFSDIYTYNVRTRQHRAITEDYFDDLDPRLATMDGEIGIIFSSNRPESLLVKMEIDTVLPEYQHDLFFLTLKGKSYQLKRVTQTPAISERLPIQTNDKLYYTSAASGINNLYSLDLATNKSTPETNLDRNIILHEPLFGKNKHLLMYYYNGGYRVYNRVVSQDRGKRLPAKTAYNIEVERSSGIGPLILSEVGTATPDTMREGYLFQSEYSDPTYIEPILETNQATTKNPKTIVLPNQALFNNYYPNNKVHKFNPSKIVASRVRFRVDNFTTKMDNEPLFEGLESVAGDQNNLNYNPIGILLKADIRDIFEDHEIEAGARFPTTFNGSEYFINYNNNKKLIDRRYTLYRRSFLEGVDDSSFPTIQTRKTSWLGMAQWKYPFDVYRSLRLISSLRVDRFHTRAIDRASFERPVITEERLGLRLEYIFDSSMDIDINIKHGTRYKFYAEGFNRFNLDIADGFSFDPSEGYTFVLGFDARHYIPLLKHSVIALRASAATSFGNEKMLYYLGGVNNWIFSTFDQSIPQPTDTRFAFRTAVPHLRGFDFNIRNGASYSLVNIETRIPFIKYFSKHEVKNQFLRHLQLVLFMDAGMAWHGLTPYSEENILNQISLSRPPTVFLNVEYFRDPLIVGFGTGLRANLLGYFIKLDYAWGVETQVIGDPKLYFSIGMDF